MIRRILYMLTVPATLLVGCNSSDASVSLMHSDSSGVEIATVAELPSLDDAGYSWRADTVRAVSVDRGVYMEPIIYRPQAMARFADGRIVISDQADLRISVLDATGDTVLSRFARRGGGPGEVRGFAYVWPGPEESVWVLDFGNARLSQFDLQGILLAEHSMIRSGQGTVIGKVRADPPGLFLHQWFTSPNPVSRAFQDSIVSVDVASAAYRSMVPLPRQPGPITEYKTLSPRTIFAPMAGGFVIGTTHDPSFGYFDNQGRLERLIRIPLTPRASSAADIPSYVALAQSIAELRSLDMSDIEFHAYYPLLIDMLALDDSVFVLSHTSWHHPREDPRMAFGQIVWRLFDIQGNYRGHIRLPDTFQPFWTGRRRVLGMTSDSVGMQTLLDLRLVPPAR